MPESRYSTTVLRRLLENERIATLAQLKQALGTSSTMTVFRKLKALGYRSSYSHRGEYYTLRDLPDFDAQGLWDWQAVWFSQYGNLLETACALVAEADSGFTVAELEGVVHVGCQRALLQLCRQQRLTRARLDGVWVYLSVEGRQQRRQRDGRQGRAGEMVQPRVAALSQELRAAIILFVSLLDERQRRLYAGLESRKWGHGGDRQLAALLGLDAHTVARGRRELFSGEVEPGRVRRAGAGRQAVEKKAPPSSSGSGD